MAIAAARAGKHIAVEKPLCVSLVEADNMITALEETGVRGQYLENLCFSPSYRAAVDIVNSGGLGDIFFVRCCENSGEDSGSIHETGEAHEGGGDPGTAASEETGDPKKVAVSLPWYAEAAKAGGGMLLTTGCHCITYVYYLLGRPDPERVFAEVIPAYRDGSLEAAAYMTIRFRNGQIAWIDSSDICTLGTFDDRAEIYGKEGTIFLDLYRSTSMKVYSERGYGDIGRSAFWQASGTTTGWTHPLPDEKQSLGYEAELRHFLQSILGDTDPAISLQDGKVTLEIIFAAYEAARRHESVPIRETQSPSHKLRGT
jgi:predicted dehydrogenase